MKKVALLLVSIFVFCIIFSVVSLCSYKNELRRALSLWDTIVYSEEIEEGNPKIDEVIDIYKNVSKRHKHLWNAGYSQHSDFLKLLHYRKNFYTWEQVVQQEIEIYERWFAANPDDKNHLMFYAMYLLETERKGEGLKILSELYNPEYEYDYEISETFDVKSIMNFFSGLLLNKLSKEQFKGTIYEEFFDYSVSEIIGITNDSM